MRVPDLPFVLPVRRNFILPPRARCGPMEKCHGWKIVEYQLGVAYGEQIRMADSDTFVWRTRLSVTDMHTFVQTNRVNTQNLTQLSALLKKI